MKKLVLFCAVAAMYAGLCSTATASPTLSYTDSSQTVSENTSTAKDDSSESFIEEWWNWLLDDIFGFDQGHRRRYTPAVTNSSQDLGDGDLGYDTGDGDWYYDPGDDWYYDPGDDWYDNPGGGDGYDDNWGQDPGSGGSGGNDCGGDTDVSPIQPIPAPGALLLGSIGTGILGWLRRRGAF